MDSGQFFIQKAARWGTGSTKQHRVGFLNVRAEHHAGLLLVRVSASSASKHFRAEINFHRGQFRLRVRGQRIIDADAGAIDGFGLVHPVNSTTASSSRK